MASGRTVKAYLSSIRSPSIRSRIWKELRKRGYDFSRMNDDNREIMEKAIFNVEDERECKFGHKDSLVVAMRAARNKVCDDLGWNEYRTAA